MVINLCSYTGHIRVYTGKVLQMSNGCGLKMTNILIVLGDRVNSYEYCGLEKLLLLHHIA